MALLLFHCGQLRFPRLLHLLIDYPISLLKGPRTLSFPSNQDRVHPLHKKLTLLACKLPGIPFKKLPRSFSNPGEGVH